MAGVGKNGYQKQVMEIYQFISDHLYFNRPDMEIKGERFNSAILLSLLTGLEERKRIDHWRTGVGEDDLCRICLFAHLPISIGCDLGK